MSKVIASFFVVVVGGVLLGQEGNTDKDAIKKVVESYYKSDYHVRYKFVRNGENMKAEMERFYANRPETKLEITKTDIQTTKINDHAFTTVSTMEGTSNGKPFKQKGLRTYVRKVQGDWLVDWHATTGQNSIRLKTFRAVKPTDETVLRMTAEISDYYNFQFSNTKQTHWSVRLTENKSLPAADVLSIHGYVAKDSAIGKELFDLLKDGEKHEITVAVKTNGREGTVAEITKFVSKNWYID